jgi:hypothetical protein
MAVCLPFLSHFLVGYALIVMLAPSVPQSVKGRGGGKFVFLFPAPCPRSLPPLPAQGEGEYIHPLELSI